MNARSPLHRCAALLAGAAVAFVAPVSARLVGGTTESRTLADPATEVERSVAGRRWVAWKAPARDGRTVGCFSSWGPGGAGACGCSLAERQHNWGTNDRDAMGGGDLEIYAAVRGGTIEEIVLASASCPVRADGERVTLLDGVDPALGVELLAELARAGSGDEGKRDVGEKALAAIAHHSAVVVPAAGPALARVAREAGDGERRGQALFWLSQTGDDRAPRWIREAIERDPERGVREQGVFALSQLDDSTDQLLALIRESRDQPVRRQALFWLGQSDDPKALAEIERVLLR